MPDEPGSFPASASLLSLHRLEQILVQQKFPFFFAGLGVVCLILAGIFFGKTAREEKSEVVFSTSGQDAKETETWVVDIEGEIEHPGVYTVGKDTRVGEVIEKAGGLTAQADREWINQYVNKAARLSDGFKIYIPKVGEKQAKGTGSSPPKEETEKTIGRISINGATREELEELPGVGEKTAEKIIAGRPYVFIEELMEKKIVTQSVYEKIRALVTVY